MLWWIVAVVVILAVALGVFLLGFFDDPVSKEHLLDEGDRVVLRAIVFRANSEQALIEFKSMEGPFSVRVPTSELLAVKDQA